jgi:DNA-binding transcriptional LysR family regulator
MLRVSARQAYLSELKGRDSILNVGLWPSRLQNTHRVRRNITLRVPGLHVLPMIVANSDLVAVIPSRLAQIFASRVPIKVLPPPVAMPPFDICLHWHERYHHDPAIRWMRRAFVGLFSHERR